MFQTHYQTLPYPETKENKLKPGLKLNHNIPVYKSPFTWRFKTTTKKTRRGCQTQDIKSFEYTIKSDRNPSITRGVVAWASRQRGRNSVASSSEKWNLIRKDDNNLNQIVIARLIKIFTL